MKTLLIIGALVLVGGAFALPFASEYGARTAITEHRDATWAPGATYWAARINMRLWRYEVAAQLLEDGLATWPDAWWRRRGTYYLALSHEAANRPQDARRWYESYIGSYPEGEYTQQARKRIVNIDAQE